MNAEKFLLEVYKKIPKHNNVELIYEDTVIKVLFGEGNELEVRYPCGICYTKNTVNDDMSNMIQEEIEETFRTVKEYVTNMEKCNELIYDTTNMKHKKLAEFNNYVFTGTVAPDGNYLFSIWDSSKGVPGYCKRYSDYDIGKETFAILSGLVRENIELSTRELIEIYRALADSLEGGYELTDEQEETMETIQEKIKEFVPDFDKKLKMEIDRQEEIKEQELN